LQCQASKLLQTQIYSIERTYQTQEPASSAPYSLALAPLLSAAAPCSSLRCSGTVPVCASTMEVNGVVILQASNITVHSKKSAGRCIANGCSAQHHLTVQYKWTRVLASKPSTVLQCIRYAYLHLLLVSSRKGSSRESPLLSASPCEVSATLQSLHLSSCCHG
jgi:hypothetical protein